MKKGFMFKLLLILSLAAAALLWILQVAEVIPENIPVGMWAIVIAAGGWGVAFVCRALFSKNTSIPPVMKRVSVIIGIGLILVAVLGIVNIYQWGEKWVLPIVAIAGVTALLVMLFATGGQGQNTGDNQKVGYKDYWARRAEKEAQEKKDQENNQ
ncbi:MAG: hypothetical protein FWH03_08350 [Firmicutes bacterium]|nr:hypothetical protein [Bacillota bacterium]